MIEVSTETREIARKNHSLILQSVASRGNAHVAHHIGKSESTVSRWTAEDAERVSMILASIGIKCVPSKMRCFDPAKIGAILTLAKEHLAQVDRPEQLTWEDQ